MIHYIENEFLKVGVKEYGCELTSILSKSTGYEYLWQGDESIWYGQSPILFPIVGRLIEDKYTLNGKEYTMPKHGFARKTQWTLLEKEADSLSFILSESEETLKIYPFEFDLIVYAPYRSVEGFVCDMEVGSVSYYSFILLKVGL